MTIAHPRRGSVNGVKVGVIVIRTLRCGCLACAVAARYGSVNGSMLSQYLGPARDHQSLIVVGTVPVVTDTRCDNLEEVIAANE